MQLLLRNETISVWKILAIPPYLLTGQSTADKSHRRMQHLEKGGGGCSLLNKRGGPYPLDPRPPWIRLWISSKGWVFSSDMFRIFCWRRQIFFFWTIGYFSLNFQYSWLSACHRLYRQMASIWNPGMGSGLFLKNWLGSHIFKNNGWAPSF